MGHLICLSELNSLFRVFRGPSPHACLDLLPRCQELRAVFHFWWLRHFRQEEHLLHPPGRFDPLYKRGYAARLGRPAPAHPESQVAAAHPPAPPTLSTPRPTRSASASGPSSSRTNLRSSSSPRRQLQSAHQTAYLKLSRSYSRRSNLAVYYR